MVARFHYDDRVFQQLLTDKLAPKEQGDVAEHIEVCADCQSRLEAIAETDIGWEDIRRFLQPEEKVTWRAADAPTTFSSGEAADWGTVNFLAASDESDSLGRFGRYEIKEILGRGGMGVVMRGYDPALDRHSAIKVLAPELATNAAARSRFSREAKSAAAVVHEHVVPIQTVDQHNGLPYLVMPVVEGQSLEQRVGKTGPLELKEVLRIGMQIASGLAAAHAQGLVHRDVKPANILLQNGVERVMITDFGLARTVDEASMTRSGVIAGTPQYMSPEQARGNDIDHRSDLFSLGSVLYFMCTGRSPFRAETTMGVLNRIVNDDPRSLRMINPDTPVWLQNIIERLLAKDPGRRFQSANEVAELLSEWLAYVQQPEVTPQPANVKKSTAGSGNRWRPPTRKVLAGSLGGLLLALAAVLIVLEWNKGTIVIDCASPNVTVQMIKGDEVYEKLTVTPSNNSIRIAAGQYIVKVEGKHDTLKVADDVVTVTRGDAVLVKITQKSASVNSQAASQNGLSASKPQSQPDDGPATKSLQALKQLQGTWIPTRKFGAGPLGREPGSLRFTVVDTSCIISWLDSDHNARTVLRGILNVSARRTPWRIDLSFLPLGPPPTALFGEWELVEDRLKITWTGVNNPREFIGPVPAVWEFVRGGEDELTTTMRSTWPVPAQWKVKRGVEDPSLPGNSLEASVREFNEKYAAACPDHGQPPLTVDELIASVRWAKMRRKEDFPPQLAAGFDMLLEQHRLPEDWKLTLTQRIMNARELLCWLIALQCPQGSHTIRLRMLQQNNPTDISAAAVDTDAIPLAASVREFNESHGYSQLGKQQPPLTVEEVVAAIHWWRFRREEAPVTNGEFNSFQQIADTGSLPKDARFELLTTFEPGDGYEYVIWSLRIVMPRTAKPGWTFGYGIRERYISSRVVCRSESLER